MIVGIDGDVLRYELGAVAMEKVEIFDDFITQRPWPDIDVEALVDDRIKFIVDRTGAESAQVYLTGSGNYRESLATIAPYKGHRAGLEKPYHWKTVSDYLVSRHNAITANGIEADDLLALQGVRHSGEYIIASRDKDLRMTPCWHYSWPCGDTQPEVPLHKVEGVGTIWVRVKERVNKKGKIEREYKLMGNGLKFFYGQLLTGDSVDNIKGCPGVGPVKAFELLEKAQTDEEMFKAAALQYQRKYGDKWRDFLYENARLLWLIQDPSWVEATIEGNQHTYTVLNFWERDSYDLQ